MLFIILIAVAVVAVAFLGTIYNGLVRARNRVEEAWSDITVQLKRRYDLIPNLVETVKGYAKHEKETLDAVIKARTAAMTAQSSGTAEDVGKAENMLQRTLKSLFALSEAYPDLKANESFQQLQSELVDTEDKIQASRRLYNSSVRNYADKLQVFPTNLFASLFGFKNDRKYFEVENQEEVEEAVKVSF